MPVSVETTWTGPSVTESVAQKAISALTQAGAMAQGTAQGLARVRTGFMRDSVYVTVETEAGGVYTLTIGDSADYAIFNELGTAFMSAQPFIRPAGDQAAQALPELLSSGG